MTEEPKVCPILLAGSNRFDSHCIGKDCVWFLNFTNDCAVPVTAGILADSTICQNIFKVEKRYVELGVKDGD